MRTTVVLAALSLATLASGPALAGQRGGWHGRGGHHHGSYYRPRVFVGGGVFWNPYAFPRYYPYYVPYPVYPYPPPPPEGVPPEEPADDAEREPSTAAEDASYGLVQLRGVPDGAAVDLDGRFWLTASRLDERWLALPRGAHRLTVRVEGADPVEQQIEVQAGKTLVVRAAVRD